MAHSLTQLGVLDIIKERVRFARRRFGQYDVIDFVVVLLGYAISGEDTLEAFYERLHPFACAFMALFGRKLLPHRSSALAGSWQHLTRPLLRRCASSFSKICWTELW